jgi:NitT/TauT family transport system permease protein
MTKSWVKVHVAQVAVVAAVLIIWQYAPKVAFIRQSVKFDDPFYISSPSQVAVTIWKFATTGYNGTIIWSYLGATLLAALIGCLLGLALGALLGLLFSHYDSLARVFAVFIAAVNSVPRIAIVPIVILIAGPTLRSSVINAVLVVFFLGFYNAFEGGRSVPAAVVDNARVFGATSFGLMRQVRLPYVLIWTFAALPNAISFAIVSVVTTEILTGIKGMGDIIINATASLNANTIFAAVIILGFVGMVAQMAAFRLERRVLFWRDIERSSG